MYRNNVCLPNAYNLFDIWTNYISIATTIKLIITIIILFELIFPFPASVNADSDVHGSRCQSSQSDRCYIISSRYIILCWCVAGV